MVISLVQTGGGSNLVTSVAGKTGAVTLVEGDIASLTTDLAATEKTANKDAASGYAGLTAGSLLKAAEFPTPTTTTFGGVKDVAAVANNFVTSIVNGVAVLARPSVANLSDGVTGTGAVVLASAPTLTNPIVGTQTADDNSTKAASTAYADALCAKNETVGFGGFFGPGLEPWTPFTTSINNALTSVANQVRCQQFTLTKRTTINKVVITVGTTVAASAKLVAGIYTGDKNTLLLQATFDASVAGIQSVSPTPVTLNPGVYWFVYSGSSVTPTATVFTAITNGSAWYNQNFVRHGTAANAMASNVLPATLGTITANVASSLVAFFEP